jgi:hypothetical protein
VVKASLELQDAKDQCFVTNRDRKALHDRFTALGLDPDQVVDDLDGLAAKQTQLDQVAQKLATELAKPADQQNPALIQRLTARRDLLKGQIDTVNAEKQKVADAHLDGDLAGWKQSAQLVADHQSSSQQVLNSLDPLVWLYNATGITMSFEFPSDGSIRAAIRNWDLSSIHDPDTADSSGVSDFSTDNGAIGKVTYAEHGGVFTFEVYAPTATFYFKMFRTRYRDVDGRIHFSGEITRCSVNGPGKPVIVHVRDFVDCGVDDSVVPRAEMPGTPVLRMGIATLTDQRDQLD